MYLRLAELLELVNRTLGWQAEKTRVKIAGQTTRVIKGLKLRSSFDNQPTVEEILEGDNQVTTRVTTSGPRQILKVTRVTTQIHFSKKIKITSPYPVTVRRLAHTPRKLKTIII